ncbi:MAG TPA: hypothetical protein VJK53_05605 [Candidatus Paceibacterota bacterium]
MTTIIQADLHMGPANTQDKAMLVSWEKSVLVKHRPKRLVLNGDTWELQLPMEHENSIVHKSPIEIFSEINGRPWKDMVVCWRESLLEEIIVLEGEHDRRLRLLIDALKKELPGKRIVAAEYWYDAESQTLVTHGDKFSYDREYRRGDEYISCTPGLTVAINLFLSETPEIERRVREAVDKGIFSYWYAFAQLPAFLRAAEQLFGCDRGRYARECAHVMRGGDLDRWLACQSDWQTRVAGQLVKMAALYPPLLLWLYGPFYALLDLKTRSRMRSVLSGEHYTDKPEELAQFGPVENLVTGHRHKTKETHYREGSVYNLGCPRLSIAGIRGDVLETFRELDYVLLDGSDVSIHQHRIPHLIPIKELGL